MVLNMRIGIDARMMGAENTRGIGRYIEEMIRAMLGQIHESETLVLFERNPSRSPIQHSHVEHIKADISWYGLKEQMALPAIIKQSKIDVLWVPHWNIPLRHHGPIVITIHDLLLVRHERSAKISTQNPILFYVKYLAFRFVLHFALKKAKMIFPPTETIKNEIELFYPMSSEKLKVTGEGLGHISPSNAHTFTNKYLLYVGSAYPHKRLDLALMAWRTISKNHPSLHFFIVGEKDIFMRRFEEQVVREVLSRVHFFGVITDEDLSAYLTQAKGFIFPSEYEGFGLPPLEALLCGTPTVAADIDVMKEVLPKEGVFFFHKGHVNDMITAIELMLERGATEEEMRRAVKWIQERHTWAGAAGIAWESIRSILKKEEKHDEKKRKTRGDSGMEKDEYQRRTGTSA